MSWWRRSLVIGIASVALSSPAAAASSAPDETPIDGTDLTVSYPAEWESRPKMAPEELRPFVEAFPGIAAQFGMQVSDSDAELLVAWERIAKDFVQVSFDPRDNDTVTISVYEGDFWSDLAHWRSKQKANARLLNGDVVNTRRTTVGTHRAYTSIVTLRDGPVLIGTAVVEQPDGRYVVVSAALDRGDRRLADRILSSIETA